jgi:hypothetical protein
MAKGDAPSGQLFSRVYLERSTPVRDSKRFRTRLTGYFYEKISDSAHRLADKIRTELGVQVPWLHGPDFEKFFQQAEVRDVLDTVSLVVAVLDENHKYSQIEPWIAFVQRAFDEESLGYRVDSKGGVHYVVDEEFERNRVSAIASLTLPNFASVAKSLENAFSQFDAPSINTKAAVRDVFDALETLIKILSDSNKNLDDKMVKKDLGDLLRKIPEYTEPSGASTISKFIESLADWVNAAHPYRHGQKTEKLVAPSPASAVLFLSTGAAYIRWLVDQLGTGKP